MCICIDNKSCLKENLTYLLPSVRAKLLITVCLEIPCIAFSRSIKLIRRYSGVGRSWREGVKTFCFDIFLSIYGTQLELFWSSNESDKKSVKWRKNYTIGVIRKYRQVLICSFPHLSILKNVVPPSTINSFEPILQGRLNPGISSNAWILSFVTVF